MKHFTTLIIAWLSLTMFAQDSFGAERFEGLYLLHVPATSPKKPKPILVYWDTNRNPEKVYSLSPLLRPKLRFFSKLKKHKFRKGNIPSQGLVVESHQDTLSITGALIEALRPIPGIANIHLKAGSRDDEMCKGEATMEQLYSGDKTRKYQSKWGLRPAPDSLVYALVVNFLNEQIEEDNLSEDANPDQIIQEVKELNPRYERLKQKGRDLFTASDSESLDQLMKFPPEKVIDIVIRELEEGKVLIEAGKAEAQEVETEEFSDKEIVDKYFDFVESEVEGPE